MPVLSGLSATNAGQLDAACQQMPRWVYGTVNGVPTRLPGLVDRRDATRELCAQWGRDGHFSAALVAAKAAP
ncbi:glycoside hydrolase family protein [Delftia acidovorans]|uniref:glycoside hydrolase family protein n=1 Tax=Delftia acidovorans TaxID=80866 RepID=UPI0035CED455